MKKRILATCISALLAVSLFGCGSAKEDTKAPDTQAATEASENSTQTETEGSTKSDTETVNDTPTTEAAYEIPDVEIEPYPINESESFAFVRSMKIGVSLGNTFDAYQDGSLSDEMKTETVWQSMPTSKSIIKNYHDAGFQTIRIPVSWHNHLTDDDFTISEKWLSRVQEVVDWAMEEGMYVILNIHHDNHPEADCFYPDNAHLEQSKHYIERIWSQLATRFADYDEHLIFESMNEPRLVGHQYEWWIPAGNTDVAESAAVINTLNQTFVDTVRSAGGDYNQTRYLMCPGYDASADGALLNEFELPTDSGPLAGRIMVSVHAYTPYNFALEAPGISSFDSERKNSTKEFDSFMDKLYNKVIARGIPVVIGEFGARDKKQNVQDRIDYATYYIAAARARGMTCLWWDNNAFSGDGENFGLLYRMGGYFVYPELVEALMKYAD